MWIQDKNEWVLGVQTTRTKRIPGRIPCQAAPANPPHISWLFLYRWGKMPKSFFDTSWPSEELVTGSNKPQIPGLLRQTPKVILQAFSLLSSSIESQQSWSQSQLSQGPRRKLNYPGRTCKLHTEENQPGVKPRTTLCEGTTHCTSLHTVLHKTDVICAKTVKTYSGFETSEKMMKETLLHMFV